MKKILLVVVIVIVCAGVLYFVVKKPDGSPQNTGKELSSVPQNNTVVDKPVKKISEAKAIEIANEYFTDNLKYNFENGWKFEKAVNYNIRMDTEKEASRDRETWAVKFLLVKEGVKVGWLTIYVDVFTGEVINYGDERLL